MRYIYLLVLVVLVSCSPFSNVQTTFDRSINFNQYRSFAWVPMNYLPTNKAEGSLYGELYQNSLTEKKVKQMVNEMLSRKGYKLEVDTPDFLLTYKVYVEEDDQIVSSPIMMNPFALSMGFYYPFMNNFNSSPFFNQPFPPHYYYSNMDRIMGNYSGYPTSYMFSGSGNVMMNNFGMGFNQLPYTSIIGNQYQKVEFNEGTLIIDMIDRKTNELVWRGWSTELLDQGRTFETDLTYQVRSIMSQFP